MKTKREISTISYNTVDFLVMTLNQLIKDHVISYWMFISHLPDEDEKKHITMFISCLMDS